MNYEIIQTNNPKNHKDEIIEFWEKYLPGTPSSRFDWMQNNPAGQPIWILAFDKENNVLAGTISIMPREFLSKGRNMRAGIMGDFMTGDAYRAFGPAMKLQRRATKLVDDGYFEFIYTIPNASSIKLAQRVGFNTAIDLIQSVKPIYLSSYIRKYLKSKIVDHISPIIERCMRLFTKETYVIANVIYDEPSSFDEIFDTLFLATKERQDDLITNRDIKYLKWRYKNNPVHDFRFITCRDNSTRSLLGYIAFTKADLKIEIFDLVLIKDDHLGKMVKQISKIARNEGVQAIYFRLSNTDPLTKKIRKYMFYNAQDNISILVYKKNNIEYNQWKYFEGDRNI